MALRGTYETLKQAFQDIIAPQLERINGQIEGLKVEMQSVRNEMASLEKRMEEGFTSLRNEMQAGLFGRPQRNSIRAWRDTVRAWGSSFFAQRDDYEFLLCPQRDCVDQQTARRRNRHAGAAGRHWGKLSARTN